MAYPARPPYRLSLVDYHRMVEGGMLSEADKVELLNGEIVNMSPKGSRHTSCLKKIMSWLPEMVGKNAQIQIQDPISMPDYSEPEPDIALIERREDFYVDAHPKPQDVMLLIEIADSSLEIDRQIKGPIYAAAGIPVYWILNLHEQQIEVYDQPSEGKHQGQVILSAQDQLIVPRLGFMTSVSDWLI